MEIDVNVDESDIGSIKTGQPVRFTVQAYPDEKFSGVVRQVRLQPTTIQNVVNYTAVVDAANDRGLLLPGMTATVDFIVEQVKDVLLVPNAALLFKPPDEMLVKFKDRMPKQMAEGGARGRMSGSAVGQTAEGRPYAQAAGGPGHDSMQGAGRGRRGMGRMRTAAMSDSGAARRGGAPADSGAARGRGAWSAQSPTAGPGAPTGTGNGTAPTRVFYVDQKGSLEMTYLATGTTDGRNTEIKGSSPLAEGTQVIIGVNSSAMKQSQGSSKFSLNPRPQFGPQRRPGGGGGGPRF
jgi:HlyD family secretion protein